MVSTNIVFQWDPVMLLFLEQCMHWSSVPRSHINGLPKAWKAWLDGWKQMEGCISHLYKPYILLTKNGFLERDINDRVLETYTHVATSMEKSLDISGIHSNQMGRYFKLFPKLGDYSNWPNTGLVFRSYSSVVLWIELLWPIKHRSDLSIGFSHSCQNFGGDWTLKKQQWRGQQTDTLRAQNENENENETPSVQTHFSFQISKQTAEGSTAALEYHQHNIPGPGCCSAPWPIYQVSRDRRAIYNIWICIGLLPIPPSHSSPNTSTQYAEGPPKSVAKPAPTPGNEGIVILQIHRTISV